MSAARVEHLEDRKLLTSFAVDINFQTAAAPIPTGYIADTGAVYGNQTNGYAYGWNGPHKNTPVTRHVRKPSDGVDNLDDTFAVIRPKGVGSLWQIAVPDGTYEISVTAGDPLQAAGRYTLDVEGSVFLNGIVKPGAKRWITASGQVDVTDGFLTLTAPKGRSAKLDYIDISQVITPPVSTVPSSFNTGAVIPAAEYKAASGQMVTVSGGATGIVVSQTTAGQWLTFTVNVPTAGAYVLTASAANDAAGGAFHGVLGGANVTGSLTVPNSGSLTTFSTVTSGFFNLAAGSQTLGIYIDAPASNGTAGDFDYFEVNPYSGAPPSTAPSVDTPYSTAFAVNQIIPAADYDNGGAGVAYDVATTTNPGNDNFRPGDGVEINSGGSTGNVVSIPGASDWLNYTVNVATTGTYVFETSVSNDAAGGSFHAEVNSSNLTGAIAVPDTGSSTVFQTVTSASFSLTSGEQILHLVFDQAASNGTTGNFDTFKLVPYTPPVMTAGESPYNGTPFTIGETIPAAQYDLGGQGYGYNTTATSNPGNDNYRSPDPIGMVTGGTTGNVVGYTTIAGEWLDYTIDVTTAGSYQLSASVSNVASGGTFHAEVAGVNLTGAISVPNVGSYTSFQTVSSSSFPLSTGVHVLRIVMDTVASGGEVANFDTFTLAPVASTGSPIQPLVWKSLAQPPVPTIEGGSIGVDGKLYVFGGFYTTGNGQDGEDDGVWRGTSTCQVYTAATNTWSYIAPLPDPETHEECATDGTYIYIAGGNLYNPKTTYQTFATTEVWRYDIATNTFSAFTSLPAARGAGSLVLVGDELHFFGGVDVNRVPQSTHWELDLDSSNPQWVLDTPAPSPRNHVATFSYNGLIYLMGGRDLGTDSGLPVNTCYVFNPGTNAWSQIASMPKPLAVTCYAVVDGLLVIMGGSNDAADPIDTVIAYNPATNSWSYLNSFPSPSIGPNGSLVGNELVVSGGADVAGGPTGATVGAQIVPST